LHIPPQPPVFVGYGIHEPEHGWDDLDLIDFDHLHRAALFVLDYLSELGNSER